MASVILKVNLARIVILKFRKAKGVVGKLTLRPMVNDNDFQRVPLADWNMVKDRPLVKKYLKDGGIAIVNPDILESTDNVVDNRAAEKRLRGDILVKGREAVDSEIANALEKGDIDQVLENYPILSEAINKMVNDAVEAKTASIDDDDIVADEDDDGDDSAESPATIDALVESLDGKDGDEVKAALRDYAKAKYDTSLGNSGIPLMIEKIRSLEVNGD